MSAPGKVLNQKHNVYSNFKINSKHLPTQTILGYNETKFKQRHANHVKSFRHDTYQGLTELSNELLSIKNNSYAPNTVWEVLRKHQPETLKPLGAPCILKKNFK